MTDATAFHVASSDGTRIAVWRSGAGPAVLLVHGTTADHTRWQRITPLLEASFTVLVMDRRGRGGSGDAEAYSIEQEALDIVAVVRSVGGPVSLVGHSYGGLCCLEAALRLPTLHRLVLYEPPLPVGLPIVPPATAARLRELIERDEREAALGVFFRDVVGMSEPQLDLMRTHPVWPARIDAAHTILRESRQEEEYPADPARFAGIGVPVLLLLGGDSPVIFREATDRLHAALPDSRVHVFPGQQHVAMDLVPDRFVDALRSFLEPAQPAR